MPSSLAEKDLAHYLHPMTALAEHERRGPRIFRSGKGVYLTDVDGHEVLDAFAGLWCVNVGWGQESVVEAAAAQMAKLHYANTFFHNTTEPVIELAAKLASLTPESLQHAFFTLGGSDAVETALKLARYHHAARGHPERRNYIALERGYHGSAFAGAGITGLPMMHQYLGLPLDFEHHIPSHYAYRNPAGPDPQAIIDASVAQLEDKVAELGAETVAAFLCEPIQGAGGVIVPPAGWLTAMQETCRRHGILFILDEVITGFCRTGRFFAAEHEGLQPDLMTLAKGLTSAYVPMGAVMLSDAIYRTLVDAVPEGTSFGHGFTYSGHPVAAATALAVIKLYEDGLLEQAQRVGPYLQARMAELREHPWVGDVRGAGMLAAIELVADRDTKQPFPTQDRLYAVVLDTCYRNGLLVRVTPGEIVCLAPPLVCTEADIDVAIDRLRRSLDEVHAGAGSAPSA